MSSQPALLANLLLADTSRRLERRSPRRPVRRALALVVILTGAVGCGAAVAHPKVLLLPGVLAALALIVVSSRARLTFVVGVGMFVLQSSSAVGATKLGYLAGVTLCLFVSVIRLATGALHEHIRGFATVLTGAALLTLFLLCSLPVALANGALVSDWARDLVPYVLLAAVPVLALDAGADMRSHVAVRWLTVCGALATVAFASDWLDRRGVSTLSFGKFGLATTSLAMLGFCYALIRATLGPHRVRWTAYAVAIPVLLLITGTRNVLFLAVAAVAGIVGRPTRARVPIRRALALAAVVTAAAAVLSPWLAGRVSNDPTFLSRRFSSIGTVLSHHPENDQSYLLRARDYTFARAEIEVHPWLGTGPGHLYPGHGPTDPPTFTLDTPLVTVAKLGLVGTALYLGYLLAVAQALRRLWRAGGYTAISTASRAFGFVVVAAIPFGSFTEDKGFAFALLLLMLVAVTATRSAITVARPGTPQRSPNPVTANGERG